MTAGAWPTNRSCAVCGVGFFPKSTVQTYCSPKCREDAKYERLRNDPERWDAYLARLRSKYEPKGLSRPVRTCSVDGCDDKHLARGYCLKHYRRDRYRRGLDRDYDPSVVSALIKRYDEAGEFTTAPEPRRLLARVSASLLIPECPDCRGVMMKVPHDELDLRDCGSCRIRASLNLEEVSWLTSEARSTVRPTPTQN